MTHLKVLTINILDLGSHCHAWTSPQGLGEYLGGPQANQWASTFRSSLQTLPPMSAPHLLN